MFIRDNGKLLLAITVVFAASLLTSCAQKATEPAAPPDTRAADEAAIRAGDNTFLQCTAVKDLDKCMSLYADDAVAFASGRPAMVGKDNIRPFIQGLLAAPGMQLAIHIDGVDVARSGDMA